MLWGSLPPHKLMDVPFLDRMLTSTEAAEWMGMSERELLAKSKGRNPSIAGFWFNERVVRFHPRSVIAHMAKNAGITPVEVASMFGKPEVPTMRPPVG